MAAGLAQLLKRSYTASTTSDYARRLSTSWLIPTWLLFATRALISLYAFIVLFTLIGIETTSGRSKTAQRSFSYFTILGYWGLAFYFAFAAAHTGSLAFGRRLWLEGWPTWLRYLHSAFYMTVTVYPFIVTAVFWGVLSAGALDTQLSTWSNISEHALNSVYAFLEILLPRSDPHPWLQLVPLVLILALYLGLAYLSHATENFYAYAFLNPANGRGLVAGACVGILVGSIIVFIIVRYLILLRQRVTEKRHGWTDRPDASWDEDSIPLDEGPDKNTRHKAYADSQVNV